MEVFKRIVLGFIAGAIASLTAYELLCWLFNNPRLWTGWTQTPWSKEMVALPLLPDMQLPLVFSNLLTGGLWGSLFGLILGDHPQGPTSLKGLAMGLFGPGLIGGLFLRPMLTGGQPLLGGDIAAIVPTLVLATGFGAVAAWLYGFFRYGRLPGSDARA